MLGGGIIKQCFAAPGHPSSDSGSSEANFPELLLEPLGGNFATSPGNIRRSDVNRLPMLVNSKSCLLFAKLCKHKDISNHSNDDDDDDDDDDDNGDANDGTREV